MAVEPVFSAKYDQKAIEKTVSEFWEAEQIPQGLAQQRHGSKKFFLLDGPPYANAQPHVGHVKTTACKDVWSRFKYMQGFDSIFIPGFDCHGLPTEVMVEKELGITSKSQIEEIGVKKFDETCLEKVNNTEKGWMAYYKQLGAWRAYFEPYFTYKASYVESGWWTAKQLHEKGFLVEGERPIHWCPHCETSLSGYEVSDSYKDVSDPSIFVKFKLKGRDNEFLVVWTTTPWTLAANVAIVAHPDEQYARVRIKSTGETLVIAEKRVQAVLEEVCSRSSSDYEVIETVQGSGLDGLDYEPLLDVPQQAELAATGKAHKVRMSIVIMANKKYKKHKMKEEAPQAPQATKPEPATAAQTEGSKGFEEEEREEYEEFVTMSEGSGMVHCAPGHGQTDHFVGKYYGMPAVSPVDEHGLFTAKGGMFAGKFVKKADKEIIAHLEEQGKMLHSDYKTHRASLCWRCKTPLIFRLSRQWYLKVEPVKEKMIAANEGVRWLPDFGKTKFRNWIAQREDWCISQQRYWGIPMPIWICAKCGAKEVIGSVEELKKKAIASTLPSDFSDLHRHTVDGIKLKCSCGNQMDRVKDIFNVWYDSGIAPWASLGYPFKNKELFESVFPVDLVDESQDQIRGWFDSLMFSAMATFDKVPYKAVALMGWVLDEKGEKMSKSLGNVIFAKDGIEKMGADAIRLYYCFEVAPWEVQKFSFKNASEAQRALSILWNTLSFYETYLPQGFKPSKITSDYLAGCPVEDRYIISRQNSVALLAQKHLDNFEFHEAGRLVATFINDEFSRWYVKLVRDRTAQTAEEKDREKALSAMHYVLATTAKLLAPITPFMSEAVFQQLKKRDSSLSEKSVHYAIYPKAEDDFLDYSLEHKMKKAMVITEAANSSRADAKIKLRWPVREFFVTGDAATADAVNDLQEVLKRATNSLAVTFAAKAPAGFAEKEFDGGKLYLNPQLDADMMTLAAFRELVRAIQQSRKDNGFVVSQRIKLSVACGDAALLGHFKKNAEALQGEVGASSCTFGETAGTFGADVDFEGTKISAKFDKA
ncbi:MAG: isoleucine--tRNA ligase [Candidatus Micrarchaeia archaeon]